MKLLDRSTTNQARDTPPWRTEAGKSNTAQSLTLWDSECGQCTQNAQSRLGVTNDPPVDRLSGEWGIARAAVHPGNDFPTRHPLIKVRNRLADLIQPELTPVALFRVVKITTASAATVTLKAVPPPAVPIDARTATVDALR